MTDGTYHYTVDTAAIYKRNNDVTWSIAAQNTSPFTGIAALNHLGDGQWHGGKLYIPGEWNDGNDFNTQRILVFDAGTLAREAAYDISAQGHEATGLCIVPGDGANGTIYIVSYFDGSAIWKYDLLTMAYLGSVSIAGGGVTHAQGITAKGDFFYISETDGPILRVSKDGTRVTQVYDTNTLSTEGLDYTQDTLRVLRDPTGVQTVVYLQPSA